MDINEKLDVIMQHLDEIEEKLDVIVEQQEVIQEGISDIGLPGSGYSIISPSED